MLQRISTSPAPFDTMPRFSQGDLTAQYSAIAGAAARGVLRTDLQQHAIAPSPFRNELLSVPGSEDTVAQAMESALRDRGELDAIPDDVGYHTILMRRAAILARASQDSVMDVADRTQMNLSTLLLVPPEQTVADHLEAKSALSQINALTDSAQTSLLLVQVGTHTNRTLFSQAIAQLTYAVTILEREESGADTLFSGTHDIAIRAVFSKMLQAAKDMISHAVQTGQEALVQQATDLLGRIDYVNYQFQAGGRLPLPFVRSADDLSVMIQN